MASGGRARVRPGGVMEVSRGLRFLMSAFFTRCGWRSAPRRVRVSSVSLDGAGEEVAGFGLDDDLLEAEGDGFARLHDGGEEVASLVHAADEGEVGADFHAEAADFVALRADAVERAGGVVENLFAAFGVAAVGPGAVGVLREDVGALLRVGLGVFGQGEFAAVHAGDADAEFPGAALVADLHEVRVFAGGAKGHVVRVGLVAVGAGEVVDFPAVEPDGDLVVAAAKQVGIGLGGRFDLGEGVSADHAGGVVDFGEVEVAGVVVGGSGT